MFHIFGVEIRNAREPNRESVWVHNVVTVRTDKVAGQCAMPYTPKPKVVSLKCTRHSMSSQWRFWSNAVEEIGNDSCQCILDALKAIYMLQSCAVQDGIYLIET